MEKEIKERTLFLIKPDGVSRKIVGEIVQRVERMGFDIVASKLVKINRDIAEKHYPSTEEWKQKVGERTIEECEKNDIDIKKNMGTDNPLEIGKIVKEWNADLLCSGPVFAFVLEGYNAIERLRSLVGHTIPLKALPGTIRGDYSLDSAIVANLQKRTVYNTVHASGTIEEAKSEIDLWFTPEEILEYK